MESPIYIIGHKNPDTDSIVSALAYKELKTRLGYQNVIAGRLGELNRETRFLLQYFQVEAPERIHNLRTQVKDLELDPIEPVLQNVSIRQAWSSMVKELTKTLPVLNDRGGLVGIVSAGDIVRSYMAVSNENSYILRTTTKNLLYTLSANIIAGSSADREINGRVLIASMVPESLQQFIKKGDLVIVGDNKAIQMKAVEGGASCLVVTDCFPVEQEVLNLAKEKNCIILQTPYDSFVSARLIHQSVPVSAFMKTRDIISFSPDDYLDDIKEVMLSTRFRSYPVIDSRGKIFGVISRFHLIRPRRKKVILVDHNEISQSVEGLEQTEIIEIIDHHRIADIQTGMPVYFRNEPVGSTSTIIGRMFLENNLQPSSSIAGLLCGAILSDTVLFKSPTCTPVDREIAEKMATLAGIDLLAFGREMFEASTSTAGKSLHEIFYTDFKEYILGDYRIGISQVNTMNLEEFSPLESQLLEFMQKINDRNQFHILLLMITDILNEGSKLLFVGKDVEILKRAFGVEFTGNTLYLPGVISRKKQIIPPISSILD